ncbi:MAG: hypothetical protein ACI4W2_01845 [Eubacterium sp.]
MKVIAEPVDMIAVFRKREGCRPVPYRFRYTDRRGDRIEVHVDKVLRIENLKIGGIDTYNYTCQSLIGDMLRIYVLKYFLAQARWELYKM